METKKSKIRNCVLCQKEFSVKYPSSKVRTCSKQCKNKFVSDNTKKYYQSEEAREKTRQATIKAFDSYKEKYYEGMKHRRSYAGENHPSYGKERTPEWRLKISKANTGRFKGKTWEEIIGESRAKERKLESSYSMNETNSRLMTSRTSKLEHEIAKLIIPLGFEQNKKFHKYTVDFINNEDKIVVEIYGDYWHCNPQIYSSDYINISIDMTAQEKWDYDNQREKDIINFGYYFIKFWEKDLKSQGYDIVKSAVADFRAKQLARKQLENPDSK